jgi:hypothetical protein
MDDKLSFLQDGSNKKQIELNCLQIIIFQQYVKLSLVFQTSKCLQPPNHLEWPFATKRSTIGWEVANVFYFANTWIQN